VYWKSRWAFYTYFLLLLLGFNLKSGRNTLYVGIVLFCLIHFGCQAITPLHEDDSILPLMPGKKLGSEFKPVLRKLPEFKFWKRMMIITIATLFVCMFRKLDLNFLPFGVTWGLIFLICLLRSGKVLWRISGLGVAKK
jgi:hypothetical protein